MSRLLIIMRHAKSDWGSGALQDFDRPLNARGKVEAPRMGRWLKAQGLTPERIISSPALRASETVSHVARALGIDPGTIIWDRRVYEAGVDDLIEVLNDHLAAGATLLIGHNPGLEALARYLASADTLPDDDKLLPTAGVLVLELPRANGELREGEARCMQQMRPRLLRD